MALAVAVGAGACAGGPEQAKPVSEVEPTVATPVREVTRVVDQLERSVAASDYGSICSELLSSVARRRAGGGGCARRLRSAAGNVEAPAIELARITLGGDRATAEVVVTARGEAPALEELSLVREAGRFRILALRVPLGS